MSKAFKIIRDKKTVQKWTIPQRMLSRNFYDKTAEEKLFQMSENEKMGSNKNKLTDKTFFQNNSSDNKSYT